MLNTIFGFFSHDVGIDLGTTHTFVLVLGKGIVIREPSFVARHKKTKKILAIGTEAKKMMGKTPENIEALRPLRHGVIADFDATEAMLHYYIREVHQSGGLIPKIPRPRVVVGVPSGVTEVERRAVQEAALSAGARQAFLIEEPMAAAIGVGLPINNPAGLFLCDIGGGTTEMAIISLGGIVLNRSLRIAGDEMDEAIANFIRLKHSLLIGLPTAEEVKISLGSALPQKQERQMVIRGRDLEKGLPRSLKVSMAEVREALAPVINQIVGHLSEILEETPPELTSDIVTRGLVLCGGGALIEGLDKFIADELKLPVWVADDPMTAVVRGCGKVLEEQSLLNKVRIAGGLK
jgi:rod shape-determining protein MreB